MTAAAAAVLLPNLKAVMAVEGGTTPLRRLQTQTMAAAETAAHLRLAAMMTVVAGTSPRPLPRLAAAMVTAAVKAALPHPQAQMAAVMAAVAARPQPHSLHRLQRPPLPQALRLLTRPAGGVHQAERIKRFSGRIFLPYFQHGSNSDTH